VNPLVIGVDFGTSGVRTVAVDATSGENVASSSAGFPQWENGLFCDPDTNIFRQHPRELLESFYETVSSVVTQLGPAARKRITAISVDTTGSSPTAIGIDGRPLALSSDFHSDPDAMMILWKDHSAVSEAKQISSIWGNTYSSEWFWAKILRVARTNPKVASATATWAEHADWFPAYLCGNTVPISWKRCRSGAAHKALWGTGGRAYPSKEFFRTIDPYLEDVLATMGNLTWSSDQIFGFLSDHQAEITGLPTNIPVGVGSFDAHTAALAGGVSVGTLSKIIGTSSSDIVITDQPLSRGFSGVESAAEGSIMPNLVTIESGQAAYGDLTDWLIGLLLSGALHGVEVSTKRTFYTSIERAAAKVAIEQVPITLDWFNGRRSPHGDLSLKSAISGLTLGTSAPALYFSLLESAAFGTRRIHENLHTQGVLINNISVLGGVADRSPISMQILSDVLNRSLSIRESSDASAHGAAIFAAVVGGAHPNLLEAQQSMQLKERYRVDPNPPRVAIHTDRYLKYQALSRFQSTLDANE
jgi:L-ribulokinase